MCAPICHDLMSAHQDAMLGREHRHAEAETWLSLGENGDGTYTGRFVIPELHALLLKRHLETAQRHPDASPATATGTRWSTRRCPAPGPG